MSKMTITEALAEIKTIGKRLAKKREFVRANLFRQEKVKDPLEAEGGGREVVSRERQAIRDLERRIVSIRGSVNASNQGAELTIGKQTMTVAGWIVWRREVVPDYQRFLQKLSTGIVSTRTQARSQGVSVTDAAPKDVDDIVINIGEKDLAEEVERLEETLGTLDGQLSLLNATTMVEFE